MPDRLRDRQAAEAADFSGTADTFTALVGSEFVLLVTFQRETAESALDRHYRPRRRSVYLELPPTGIDRARPRGSVSADALL